MFPNWFSKSSGLKQYRRFRTAAKALNQKIIDAFMTEEILWKAARRLGVSGADRRLILDSEDDFSVLMDYGLYEISRHGKNLIERYQQEKGGSNQVEIDLLSAMVRARTGLFGIEHVDKRSHRLQLRELIDESRALCLTDVNFSRAPVEGLVLFLRVIALAEMAMTSGACFVFPGKMGPKLIKRWSRWSAPSERYAGFFKLSKSSGIPVMYT